MLKKKKSLLRTSFMPTMNTKIRKTDQQNQFPMIKNKKSFHDKNLNKSHKLQFKVKIANFLIKKNKKNQKKKHPRIKRK